MSYYVVFYIELETPPIQGILLNDICADILFP